MLPITPKAIKRYVAFNATRKGLFGGSKFWLGVLGLQYLGKFYSKVTKSGEDAPVVFSHDLKAGHWFEIVHEEPAPSKRKARKARKANKAAARKASKADAKPSRRRVTKALRTQRKAARRNNKLGARRVASSTISLADKALTSKQLKRRTKHRPAPLHPLEVLLQNSDD